VASPGDCSSNAYELVGTRAPNLSPATVLIRHRQIYGQNVHHKYVHKRRSCRDSPYMLSSANAIHIKLVYFIRPKCRFCQFFQKPADVGGGGNFRVRTSMKFGVYGLVRSARDQIPQISLKSDNAFWQKLYYRRRNRQTQN